MEAQVNRSIDELLDQLAATNDGMTPFNITLPIQLCVGNIINETLFGYHFKYTDTDQFEFVINSVSKHLQNLKDNVWVLIVQAWPWTRHLPIIGRKGHAEPIRDISKFQDFIAEGVNRIVQTYDTDQEPTNFVQSYLAEMKKNPQLDLINLNQVAIDFWMAGMETTSTTLRWAVLLLMKHANVQEKVRSELWSVVGRDRRLEMADKPSLPYFNATIAEIMRAANTIPFLAFHRCGFIASTEDSIVGGKLIPADTLTLPQTYSVLRDERFFDRPEAFLPERFLEIDGTTPHKKNLERLLAFGMGKRICVGEGLARMEIFLVLGTLLLRYRLEPTDPIDMKPIFSVVLAPRPFKCRVAPL
ncbi:hypothetical protein PENTCL1PPCAC_14645 [Pristionchus entomophagus]|uniref:Cytochrome P450 n=1 Tax=Pristionchus entomophagus TaxID=358040 RepID=A0AAV5TA77_9BILA|nr:hypothetical protein PENTCL1PPCAC_14645 [Pristionchus entomophagus]